MKHTYHIHGMTCNGCRNHVEEMLSTVEGVSTVSVDLEKAEAIIEMENHIPIEKCQEALEKDGGAYSIQIPGEPHHHTNKKKKVKPKGKGTCTFYCPMHCEGSGSNQPGECGNCGMAYVGLKDHLQDGHTHD